MRQLIVLALVAGGFVFGTPAHAATHQVRIQNNGFDPKSLQIDPGDTVQWTAMESGHTVTADDGRFDFHPGRLLDMGEQVSWAFGQDEEVVRYYCRRHGSPGGGGMAGVIRVGDPGSEPVPAGPVLIVPDDVQTLNGATTQASPGTRVLVRPGVYPEEVVVSVPDLEIRGLGEHPEDVVLSGAHRRDVGITVAAAGVTVANVSITRYARAGVMVDGVSGTVIENTVVHQSGLYGVQARGPAGVTVRAVQASGHGVAGIALHDCSACGARIDGGRIEGNAAGVVVRGATGVVVRGARIRGNAVGIVLRDVAGSHVTGNTITDNAATAVWVASVFDGPEPPVGAGVWISGGRANLVASNTVTGHTYNVVVTGPGPALKHRIADNSVDDSKFADLGWDGLGAGVCFKNNRRTTDGEPTSEPPAVQTLYDCALPTTVGVPDPIVDANLMSHARDAGYPI